MRINIFIVTLNGILDIEVEKALPDNSTPFRFAIHQASGTLELTQQSTTSTRIGSISGRVTVSKNGQISQFQLAQGTGATEGNIARSIFAVWQLPLPAERKELWLSEQGTVFGVAEFSYHLLKSVTPASNAFTEFNTSPFKVTIPLNTEALIFDTLIRNPPSSAASFGQPKIKGNIRALFLRDPFYPVIVQASISQDQKIEGQFDSSATTNIDIALTSPVATVANIPSAAHPTTGTLSKNNDALSPSNDGPILREQQFLKETLGSDRAPELLARLRELENLPRNKDTQKQITNLYLQIKALVMIHPQDIETLATALHDAKPDGLQVELIVGALTASNLPEAQNALVKVLRQRSSDIKLLVNVIPTMCLESASTPDSRNFLESIIASNTDPALRTVAILGLANSLRNGNLQEPQLLEQFIQKAIDAVETTTNIDERMRWLAALGNAGKGIASETLVKWSHNPDTRIRSQSAYSLRFLRTSESENRLSELLKDPASSVRSRTIDAFSDGERHQPPQSLLDYTSREPNDDLRLRMVKALSTWHSNSPDVRRLFDQLEKSDKSSSVREFAKNQRNRSSYQ